MVIAVVLVVGGVASGVTVLGLRVSHAMSHAKGSVNGFLYAVEVGDASTAQTHVCAEAPADAVQSAIASHIHRHQVVGVVIRNNTTLGSGPGSSHENAQVTVDVTLTSGVVQRDVVDVELEHGRWLVCGVTRES